MLFVSHNMGAIEALCEKGIFLTKGQINFLGDTKEAIQRYAGQNNASLSGVVDLTARKTERYGPQQLATLKSLCLLDSTGNPTDQLQMGQPASFRVEIDFKPSPR